MKAFSTLDECQEALGELAQDPANCDLHCATDWVLKGYCLSQKAPVPPPCPGPDCQKKLEAKLSQFKNKSKAQVKAMSINWLALIQEILTLLSALLNPTPAPAPTP
jgi:hypothetical protein